MSDNYSGSHLYVCRGPYTHHGIGDDMGGVIHYSGFADGLNLGPICRVDLQEFSGGKKILIKPHPNRKFSYEEAVERAESRLGENAYSLFGNNCEHFVEWCIEGKYSSDQVDRSVALSTGATTALASMGAVSTVSSAGAVAGLSGSGIMSGLASIGGTVGGGVVAGVGVLAGAGGLGMATLMSNTVLKDDKSLPQYEREARQVGRVATYTGAATATAGGIAAISAAGVSGLSAAGITSGLAAIGGTVGGGMAAGTAIVAAAPVAAAVAVGYGAYKLWQWLKD